MVVCHQKLETLLFLSEPRGLPTGLHSPDSGPLMITEHNGKAFRSFRINHLSKPNTIYQPGWLKFHTSATF